MQDSTARSERSSIIMMICTFLSRFLGIFKARAISTVFGAGAVTDAINFSYNLPNNARKLFAEGAFTTAYLPLFARSREDKERSEKIASILITFQLTFFLPLIVLIALFSKEITIFLSSFRSEEQIEIASFLLPFFFLFLIFISLSSIFASLLQARERFLAASASPIAFSLAVIFCVYFLGTRIGAVAMAIGAVSGSIMQMLVTYIAIKRRGLEFKLNFNFKDEDFKRVLSDWGPATLTSLMMVISQQITLYIASGLEVGSITAYTNSIIFYQTPYGIFFASIAGVYFPKFASIKNDEERKKELTLSLTYLFTFLYPSAIILIAFGRECIAVLLQSGEFTLENTYLTYSVLFYFLVAMIPASFVGILQRYMQSTGKYWTTVLVSLLTTVIEFSLMIFYIKKGAGAEALSKAFVFSSMIGFFIYLELIHYKDYLKLIKSLLKLVMINIPLLIYLVLYLHFQN
ncbi:MAG: murein biosynthesis integral membrane protein MurJ, partial [Sphaerochaetaceae bacterium]|nr:murein biosynthesis integral membrane protein MurJ [Sphaerochaetaceae bacterium]